MESEKRIHQLHEAKKNLVQGVKLTRLAGKFTIPPAGAVDGSADCDPDLDELLVSVGIDILFERAEAGDVSAVEALRMLFDDLSAAARASQIDDRAIAQMLSDLNINPLEL